MQHVRLVLQRLLENKLFVKAEKCGYQIPLVNFLVFIIEQGQTRQGKSQSGDRLANPHLIEANAVVPGVYKLLLPLPPGLQ